MSLIKNSTWNIAGFVLPLIVAIPAMGFIGRSLGLEKFGLFTLAYALVGYAGIFDMGLSRAVIRAIAINSNDENSIKKILGTASVFIFFLGLLATSIVYFNAARIVDLLSVSQQLREDAIQGFQYLSLAVLPLLLSTVWFSYLEGDGRFYKLSILKTVTGIAISLGPVLFIMHTASFKFAVLGLVIGRIITVLIAYIYSLEHYRKFIFRANINTLKELIKFGGWVTISNILSPIMVYFDRFFISNIVGAQSVAFYTAPAEAVSRLLMIPMAVSRVIFPKLSAKHSDAAEQTALASKLLLAFSLCIACFVIIFAKLLLLLWVGDAYLGEAVTVLRILIIGLIFNSLAQIPNAKLQAAGHSKTTALTHLTEIIPYIAILYTLVLNFGLVGAAIAWTTRVLFDYLALSYLAKKLNT